MDCLDFVAGLDDLVDGRASAAIAGEMTAHEASCSECASKASAARALDRAVAAAVLSPHPSEAVWTKVSKTMNQRQSLPWWRRGWPAWNPALVGASIAVAVAVGFLLPTARVEISGVEAASAAPTFGQAYVAGQSAMALTGNALGDPAAAVLLAIKSSGDAVRQVAR